MRNARARARMLPAYYDRDMEVWNRDLPGIEAFSRYLRRHATSPPGFQVGTSMLARVSKRNYWITGAANFKLHEGPRRHGRGDFCGEMLCIRQAKDLRVQSIVGMVVSAEHQPDDVSGRDFGVTVSCYFCRVVFREELRKRSPLKAYTKLRFVDALDLSKRCEFTVREFLQLFPNDPPFDSTIRGSL